MSSFIAEDPGFFRVSLTFSLKNFFGISYSAGVVATISLFFFFFNLKMSFFAFIHVEHFS